MLRFLPFLLVLFVVAMPVMADPQPLTPEEVEALPFSNSLNTTPNTEIMSTDVVIDLAAETHEKKAGLPQFDVTTFSSQIFWLAVTFVILYLYFAKNALPKLSSVIENRRATIRHDLEQADILSRDIDKVRTDYEAAMQHAHNKAKETLIDTQDDMRKQSELQALEFKKKTEDMIAAFETKAEQAKNAIKADLDKVAASLTSEIIAKISNLDVSESDINASVRNFSDNSQTTKEKKAA